MRSIVRRTLFAATCLTAAFGFAATTASATALAGWTLTNPSAGGTFSAGLKTGTSAVLKDLTTSQQVTCGVGAASGTAVGGTYSTGNGIASITGATWGSAASPCPGPLSSTFKATLTSGTAIKLNAVSYSAGVTSGTLSNVSVDLTGSTLLGTCTARITGTASNATYNNATGELAISNGTGLKITNVVNCTGLMNNNDNASFTATYKLAAPLISITSP
ncbi:hypothetical protein ACPXCE_02035 [Streptomyces sp. DT24]|uniref:hypothetical protein n=1 Tax=unclassified Streptomyces TaxID=2593676 RepID=UPI0023BA0F72|nr:hypothetical protein [Streptomyces sp. AM 4-1-1]WEH36789.1 hypothetical protein PZB75_27605 [Streptomyces sp. AM 4-1-1]